jgi:SAM-dependent methyltransferase
MLENPPCPVCAETSWEALGQRTFDDAPREADEYLRLRLRVLFELWAPGASRFTARFVLCRHCGFVTYLPRATSEELDAKYRLIAVEEKPRDARSHVTRLDRRRSREIACSLLPHLRRGGGSVLDFGGGNGALMAAFVSMGFTCSVVDYTRTTVPGVERIGDTLDAVPGSRSFDVVLCSHVFEHLAEPVATAERLRAVLEDGGILFVEVPLEILGGMPKPREPVTHVNFFCESSLGMTLERSGFEVSDCWTEPCTFANGLYRYGVRAVARKTDRAPSASRARPGAARALLGAGLVSRTHRAMASPRILLNPALTLRRRLFGTQ